MSGAGGSFVALGKPAYSTTGRCSPTNWRGWRKRRWVVGKVGSNCVCDEGENVGALLTARLDHR
jgi:hypothetical protein